MRLYNPKLEQKCIVSILDSPEGVRNNLMGSLKGSWFGYEPAREVHDHVMSIIQDGERIPSARILAHDTALTKRARSFLKRGAKDKSRHPARIRGGPDAKKAVHLLGKYRKQRLAHDMGNLVADELEKDNPNHEEMFTEIESLMLKARRGQDRGIVHIGVGDNFDDDEEELLSDDALELIPTGWGPFDKNTGGFGRSDLIFIAANYGGGKTTVAIDLAARVYKKGYSVLIVSLEMPRRQVWQRLWANQADIDFELLRMHRLDSAQKTKIRNLKKKWKEHGKKNKARFSVWSPGKLNPWELVNEVKAYEYDLILVDYVNLLEPISKADERVQLGEIARALKLGAGENYLNCAMVVLAQLNDENRIKYSRAMAEHADFILWWRMGEEEKATHSFILHQDKARNARQYSIQFREKFSRMQVEAIKEVSATQSPINKGKDGSDSKNGKENGKKIKKKAPARTGMSELMAL